MDSTLKALNRRFKQLYGKENYAEELVEAVFRVRAFLIDSHKHYPGAGVDIALEKLEKAPKALWSALYYATNDSHIGNTFSPLLLHYTPVPECWKELRQSIAGKPKGEYWVQQQPQFEMGFLTEPDLLRQALGREPRLKKDLYEKLTELTSPQWPLIALLDKVSGFNRAHLPLNSNTPEAYETHRKSWNLLVKYTHTRIAEHVVSEADKALVYGQGYAIPGEESEYVGQEVIQNLRAAGMSARDAGQVLLGMKISTHESINRQYPEGLGKGDMDPKKLNALFKKQYHQDDYATRLMDAVFTVREYLIAPGLDVSETKAFEALGHLEKAPEILQPTLFFAIRHTDEELGSTVDFVMEIDRPWAELRREVVEKKSEKADVTSHSPTSLQDHYRKYLLHQDLSKLASPERPVRKMLDEVGMVYYEAGDAPTIVRAQRNHKAEYCHHTIRLAHAMAAANLASKKDKQVIYSLGRISQGDTVDNTAQELRSFLMSHGAGKHIAALAIEKIKQSILDAMKEHYPDGMAKSGRGT